MDDIFKEDLSDMINDLRKTLTEEEFTGFAEVLKEALGEFLMNVYTSTEEKLTIEDMTLDLKNIIIRRFEEL